MNRKKESKVVPNVRFKGFTDDWKQRKLGEVATFINGRAYSQDELQNSGKYKVLRVGNFYTNDSWYFSDMELDEKYYAKDGDLLYTWSATFGPHIWHGDKVIYHYHIWKVELSNILEKRFAVQLLEQDKDKILSDKNGSTMVHITKSGMEQKKVLLPPSIKEQANIGEYFSSIDHLITLHQQKITLLTKLKKTMLEKMFPKKGSVIPEFRFNGFANAWEQRKLGDEAEEILAGGDIDKEKAVDDGVYPIYANALTNDGIVGYYDDFYRVKAPAVTVTGRGEVGRARARMIDFTPVVRLLAVRSNHDCYFLENAINNHKVVVESTGVPQLTVPQLSSYDICFPKDIVEERKIGTYFNQLDHLITLHQRKLDMLKKLKSACLSEMFI